MKEKLIEQWKSVDWIKCILTALLFFATIVTTITCTMAFLDSQGALADWAW